MSVGILCPILGYICNFCTSMIVSEIILYNNIKGPYINDVGRNIEKSPLPSSHCRILSVRPKKLLHHVMATQS